MPYALPESAAAWPATVQGFEANAILTGGPSCPDNLPLVDLVNRTAWLKQRVDSQGQAANGFAPIVSPVFTGTPQAPTPQAGNNSTQIATTAFVYNYVVAAMNGGAPLASPTFTGIPAGPTAAVDTNNGQLATTAFVLGQAGTSAPLGNGVASAGVSLRWSRMDHVHPTDSSRAPLTSPGFTGVPAAPTAGTGTNSSQIATTAFVQQELGANFLASKVAQGYQKLPSGLILQWGSTLAGPPGTPVTSSLPIAFPNAALQVVASYDAPTAPNIPALAASATTTSISLAASSGGGTAYTRWLVIGY